MKNLLRAGNCFYLPNFVSDVTAYFCRLRPLLTLYISWKVYSMLRACECARCFEAGIAQALQAAC